jgi:hypothetical protein
MNTMLYPELYKSLESVRWDMEKDIPWDTFDASLLTDEQAATIKMNAIRMVCVARNGNVPARQPP